MFTSFLPSRSLFLDGLLVYFVDNLHPCCPRRARAGHVNEVVSFKMWAARLEFRSDQNENDFNTWFISYLNVDFWSDLLLGGKAYMFEQAQSQKVSPRNVLKAFFGTLAGNISLKKIQHAMQFSRLCSNARMGGNVPFKFLRFWPKMQFNENVRNVGRKSE